MLETNRDSVTISPISDRDLDEVSRFLKQNMEPERELEFWQRVSSPPWSQQGPNHGFLLKVGGRIVGAYLAYYSERESAGQTFRLCNLGTWCVDPEHRFHSIRLLRAILAQEGYSFTDFTPSKRVVAINRRLGFTVLEGTRITAHVAALQVKGWRGARVLTGEEAQRCLDELGQGTTLRDHQGVPGIEHAVLTDGKQACHLIFRNQRRHGIKLSLLLYASDPRLLRRHSVRLAWHLLKRHGAALILAEQRVAAGLCRLRKELGEPSPRMLLSAGISSDEVDYLYSEMVCLPEGG